MHFIHSDSGRQDNMTVVNRGSSGGMEPERSREGTLLHVVETLLDKGLVLNADIMASVAGGELLGMRIRVALAVFDTAARDGLEFPDGTDTETVAWQNAIEAKESCPNCGKVSSVDNLLNEFCQWCGWQSAQALQNSSADETPVTETEPEAAELNGATEEPS